jgi:peptide/nickel transport system permease protein
VIVGLAAPTVTIILCVIIGVVSGYMGGKIDLFLQRLIDALHCLPGLVFYMVLLTITGPGIVQVILVMGLRWGIIGSRVIRSAVIRIKGNDYVAAAKSIGCPTSRILIRHIVPNIVAPAVVLFTTRVPEVIITEASLSFLGFGVPPPFPSWGSMLSGSGRLYMLEAPWMAIWPGVALALTVYGINMFGDALRDILDPRMRGGGTILGAQRKKLEAQRKRSKAR